MSAPAIRLQTGDVAPNFSLKDQDDVVVTLEQLRGERVILYFYPEALTEGCTKQACSLRDNMGSFEAAGYRVIGVSRDDTAKLRDFRDRDHLNFTLLSDPDLVAHEAYGVWGEKNSYGRIVTGVIRSTFVINEDGAISLALYNVKATGHADMLRKKLKLA